MRFATCQLQDETLYLRFNIEAMFEIQDKFGSLPKAFEALNKTNLKDTYKLAEILCTQGELSRRYLGFDEGHIWTEKELITTMQLKDVPLLQSAIVSALSDGMQEPEEGQRIDKGLLELNKAKKIDETLIYYAAGKLGISVKDALFMSVEDFFKTLNRNSKK